MSENVVNMSLYQEVKNEEMRLGWCEYCGRTTGRFETHHIRTRGSGGPDIKANKINLCIECHRMAQEYKIKPYELIIRVAKREKVSVEEVYKAIGMQVPENIEELEEMAENLETDTKSLEDLINALISLEENSHQLKFLQGEIIDEMAKRGVKYSWIANQIGRSAAYIRTLHKTYQAFPTEESRVPTLSWTHHKIAAFTDDPEKWIARAAGMDENGSETGEEMSTRELRAAIRKELDEEEAEEEKEKSYKKARKVFDDFMSIVENGGEPAEWLVSEVIKLLDELGKKNRKKISA